MTYSLCLFSLDWTKALLLLLYLEKWDTIGKKTIGCNFKYFFNQPRTIIPIFIILNSNAPQNWPYISISEIKPGIFEGRKNKQITPYISLSFVPLISRKWSFSIVFTNPVLLFYIGKVLQMWVFPNCRLFWKHESCWDSLVGMFLRCLCPDCHSLASEPPQAQLMP